MAIWNTSITVSDVFNDESLPLETLKTTVISRIRDDAFCSALLTTDDGCELADILDSLCVVDDEDEFNEAWADLYDWADAHRVWIETIA